MSPKSILLAAAFVLPTSAFSATIDFDALDSSSSQTLLTSFTEDGFSFDVSFVSDGTATGVAIFDTTCTGAACNGDTDLTPATQGENGVSGNVMILQENGVAIPDDDFNGGLFILTLTSGPAFNFVGASAIDDTSFDFGTIIDGVSQDYASIDLSANSETDMVTFLSDTVEIGDSIFVRSYGSGGFDSLVLSPVPVPLPAGLPLMLAGVGAFAWMRRKSA
ncbi:MAG: VPLPA-CTERM sorting domain-containing protein [Pseudomonadota bacterium]